MTDSNEIKELELKLSGPLIKRLDGAPVTALAESLLAIQRLVHLIGMIRSGKLIAQRVKPSSKIRNEYKVVCRPSYKGSFAQPFSIESINGSQSADAIVAEADLLEILKAFDSGNESELQRILPNSRERWFISDAAAGLLPIEGDELEINVRRGGRGPFAFKSSNAKKLIERVRKNRPKGTDLNTVVGKVKNLDYSTTSLYIKPKNQSLVRVPYSLNAELFIESNKRKLLEVTGVPEYNDNGTLVRFKKVAKISEIEPSHEPIENIKVGTDTYITPNYALRVLLTYDAQESIFYSKNDDVGLDIFLDDYKNWNESISREISFLWNEYACCEDSKLDSGALTIKHNMLRVFRETRDA